MILAENKAGRSCFSRFVIRNLRDLPGTFFKFKLLLREWLIVSIVINNHLKILHA